MIKFDTDHKLIWKKINKEQAETFIEFLKAELGRHLVERGMTDQKAQTALREKNELLAELWKSAWQRHVEDIADIEKLIREVKEYFGI